MASKANIFNSLPSHLSDSEDEGTQQNTRVNKKTTENKTNKTGNKTAPGANKEQHSRPKDTRPPKGVTSEPHPLDRHSGTGQSAYGGKPKKGGAGKGNWGSEKRPAEVREEGEEREVEETTQEKVEEEQKPELTLQEYYQKRGQAQNEPQVNEAKAKITSEQLFKEMGTATLLKTKNQQTIDDRKAGRKKDHLDVDHHAATNTEHASLLNFRTGFVEKEYKQRGQDDATRTGAPRTGAPRTRKNEEVKEETQAATEATEATEAQPVTEGQATATATEGAATEGQEQNKRRGEGQRGGNRGGNRGGDRPQGQRRPQGGKSGQTKVDIADESAFPKLG